MPTYDFRCELCDKRFTRRMSLAEYQKKNYDCPECKSHKVKRQISEFQTRTSKKS